MEKVRSSLRSSTRSSLTQKEQERFWQILLGRDDVSHLTEEDAETLQYRILGLIKQLDLIPRSFWRTWEELILRIDMLRDAQNGEIDADAELYLGVREDEIDFIVLALAEGAHLKKSIYRQFRRYNLIVVKGPDDPLSTSDLNYAIGYADLFLSMMEEDDGHHHHDVTLSIFHPKKNQALFQAMEMAGELEADDETKGIYHVRRLSPFPFQIVILSELEGDEYAAERAMTDRDRARAEDLVRLMDSCADETDEAIQAYLKKVLEKTASNNPRTFKAAKRKIHERTSSLMDLFQDELVKRDWETKANLLFRLVSLGKLDPAYAASEVQMSSHEFLAAMQQKGYSLPEMQHVTEK